MSIQIVPLRLDAVVAPGEDLVKLLLDALDQNHQQIVTGDILVVAQKVVSKSEGRIVRIDDIKPSSKARRIARINAKEAAHVEVILREAKEIVVAWKGIIITETHHGFVCANSGVDQSNIEANYAVLLPKDPDASASGLRQGIKNRFGVDVAVIITDTFGRAFRMGQTNVAIGLSGIKPLKSYIGTKDMFGKVLRVTEIAVADEIASAAELVMGKLDGIPFVLVRGYQYERSNRSNARLLARKKQDDLFRV